MQRSLSPRLRRLVQATLPNARAQAWTSSLTNYVDSIMSVTTFFEDGKALNKEVDIDEAEAQAIWDAADAEADAIAEAMAHVKAVANRHADKPPDEAATPAKTGASSYKRLCGGRKARKLHHEDAPRTRRTKSSRRLWIRPTPSSTKQRHGPSGPRPWTRPT